MRMKRHTQQPKTCFRRLCQLRMMLSVHVILLISIHISFAQSGEQIGTIRTAPDTATINKLMDAAYLVRETSSDSAGAIYQQALRMSEATGYKMGMAKSLYGIGRFYNIKNQQQKSVESLRSCIAYCDSSLEGNELRASAHILMSESFYYSGRFDSCAWYRYEALNIIETKRIQNPMMQMRVYGKLLQFWLNAHQDIRNDPYVQELASHIDKLEKIAVQTHDSTLLLHAYFQKAGYFSNTGRPDSARIYCMKNLALGEAKGNFSVSMRVSSLLNIGLTYMEQKQPEAAIPWYKKGLAAIPVQDKATDRYRIFAHIFLGEAWCMQHKYAEAIGITKPALERANELNILSITDHACQTLADSYEAIGDFKQAAIYRKKYADVRDSIMKTERLELVYNVEMKNRISEKNKQLAEQQLAIVRQQNTLKNKNIFIWGISAGLLVISIISFLVYRNNRNRQKLQAQKINTMQQEMEINRLKGVISGEEKERSRIARDLHDGMGGTLGSIRGQLSMIYRKHKTDDVNADFIEVMALLEEAAAELRKTAHNLMPEILLQEGLAKATALFCERISKGQTLAIQFESWGETQPLAPDFELMAYRIIQELIHNIVKHAQATEANVQLVFHEKQLCVTVEDNGRGIPVTPGGQVDGMGLKTIRERVHSLHGQIDIQSEPGNGTSIYIEFNIPAPRHVAEKVCI